MPRSRAVAGAPYVRVAIKELADRHFREPRFLDGYQLRGQGLKEVGEFLLLGPDPPML